jgi:hypothetical protein
VSAGVLVSSGPGWFLLGCLLGVFALVMVVALPAAPHEPAAPPVQLGRGDWWLIGFTLAVVGLNLAQRIW